MKIEKLNIADVLPANYNPRKISAKELNALKENIKRFGLVEPIVYNKKSSTVVGGHQRLDALKQLGYTTVDAVIVDLDLPDEMALNLVLNKTKGEFDTDKLRLLLNEIKNTEPDLLATGYLITDKELSAPAHATLDNANSEMLETTGVVLEKLYFSNEDYAVYVSKLKDLQAHYGTKTVTETVYAIVEKQVGEQ